MKTSFGSNAFFLYSESLLTLFLGYIFWIVVSSQVGAANTGVSSSAITISTLVSTVATLGISTGIQRFLGMANAKADTPTFNALGRFLIIFTVVLMGAGSGCLLIINHFFIFLDFSNLMFYIIIFASISYSLVLSLRSIAISSSKTRVLLIASIVGHVFRFVSLVPIIFLKLGPEAIAFSYIIYYIAVAGLSAYFMRSALIRHTISHIQQSIFCKREIIIASISGWVPNAISVLGTQSGILIVFGLKGSAEAGIYFIAFSIFSAISALPISVLTLTFPVMSGMVAGREGLMWKTTKIALFITLPIAAAVTIYPSSILTLFGKDFSSGSSILTILMFSIAMVEFNRAISYLAYSHGRYRQVLVLGAVPSLVRIMAYILLAPIYGGLGAAYAFLVGSLVGLISAVIADKKNQYKLPYGAISAMTVLPFAIGSILLVLNVPVILGFLLIMFVSYILFARMKLISYNDAEESINSLISKPNAFTRNILSVAKIIFG